MLFIVINLYMYIKQYISVTAHNNQVNMGRSLLRKPCGWLRHSVTSPATQTAPITTVVMCLVLNE